MEKLKKYGCFLLSVLSIALLGGCGQQSVEDTGTLVIQSEDQEQRVVALSVSLVEILEKLNVDLVGVPKTQYELSDAMAQVTQVGLPMSPDVEMIASLKPTHVLSVTTLESMAGGKLEAVGLSPIYMNMENITGLKETISSLGKMFDCEEEAANLLADFESEVNTTLEGISGKDRPKVLILFGFPGSYLAATPTSFVGQMVELLGGVNIVTKENMSYADVNLEALLVEKPDVILRMTHGVKEDVLEMFAKEFNENPIWSQFEAVQNGSVVDLDDSLFNVSASLKTSTALEKLADILYE